MRCEAMHQNEFMVGGFEPIDISQRLRKEVFMSLSGIFVSVGARTGNLNIIMVAGQLLYSIRCRHQRPWGSVLDK
jgi:hypothetical protein